MIVRLLAYFGIILCGLSLSSPLHAAEVTNLKPSYSTSQLTIEFDLIGKKSETTTGVELFMDIHGKRYSTAMLTISGDYGGSVPLGKKRRIIWKHSKDFPEGLDKTFKCIVNAVPESALRQQEETPSEGFRNSFYAVNRQVVAEKRTKLMWTRTAAISPKPMQHADAVNLVQTLNRERYAGYDDWRMPTREDMEGLMFFGQKAGWWTGLGHYIGDYLATCGFKDIQYGNYWTATASDASGQHYYVANTWNGAIRSLAGANYYYLWPVRSIQ